MTSPEMIEALGRTLLHFLWQGTALLLAFESLICFFRSPRVRYGFGLVALAAMTVTPLLTFRALFLHPTTFNDLPWRIAFSHAANPLWLNGLVAAWFAGVGCLAVRMAGGWYVANSLRHHQTSPLSPAFLARCQQMCAQLAISQPVRFLQSAMVNAPAAIGWLRPVVLIPSSAVLGLTPLQLEAIIAHELAHIRRFDMLVNVLQMAVETVLFYHPAVWWISRRIRIEREHCCDDVAAALTGDPLSFAKALATLEECRAVPLPMLAANGGLLKQRISRLVGLSARGNAMSPIAIGGIVAACFTAFLVAPAAPEAIAPLHVANARPIPPITLAVNVPEVLVPQKAVFTQAVKPRAPARIATALHAGGVSGARELDVLQSLGVGADYVSELRAIWPNVSTSQIVDLHTAGIAPEYVRTLQAAGINLGEVAAHNVVAYKATGVTPDLITALQSMGIADLAPNDYLVAQVRGLTPEFLATVRKHNFTNVTIRWLIAAKKTELFG